MSEQWGISPLRELYAAWHADQVEARARAEMLRRLMVTEEQVAALRERASQRQLALPAPREAGE